MGWQMTTDHGTFITTAAYFDVVRALLDLHRAEAPFANPEGRRAWIKRDQAKARPRRRHLAG